MCDLACRTESPVQLELATNSQLAISLPALAVLLRRKMPVWVFVFSREGNLHLRNRTYRPRGLLGWKARTVNHTTAIFQQINKHNPYTHHNALEFSDGKVALLSDPFEGQEATVLQLPAQPVTAAEITAQERVPHT
jgi:hypothetical protein